jgi:hypothetical protein
MCPSRNIRATYIPHTPSGTQPAATVHSFSPGATHGPLSATLASGLSCGSPRLETVRDGWHIPRMKKSDITCPECHAGYRRIEIESIDGTKGEFCCLLCGQLLEVFDGKTNVAIRLTVQPEKTFLPS